MKRNRGNLEPLLFFYLEETRLETETKTNAINADQLHAEVKLKTIVYAGLK